jgi:hypothetical protein
LKGSMSTHQHTFVYDSTFIDCAADSCGNKEAELSSTDTEEKSIKRSYTMQHHTSNTSNTSTLKNAKSASSTAMTSRNTSKSSSSTYTYNETTSLLPHERTPSAPQTSPQSKKLQKQSTTSSATASLHHILTLHPRQIAILEAARAEEEAAAERDDQTEEDEEGMNRHVLSRIDCIEIDLWHERIRDYEAAELGLVRAEELGLIRDGEEEEEETRENIRVEVDEVDGARLSRVQTYVNDFGDVDGGGVCGSAGGKRRKVSSVAHTARLGSTSLSLDHFHPYFWVDMMGICLMVMLVLMFLVFIGLKIRYDREGICQGRGVRAAGFWVAVQMVVAIGTGLMLQVPVHRGLVPFVLPLWVVGTLGIVIGLKALAGCLKD